MQAEWLGGTHTRLSQSSALYASSCHRLAIQQNGELWSAYVPKRLIKLGTIIVKDNAIPE